MITRATRVLAIDPGRWKCGVAVVDVTSGLLERTVVGAGALPGLVREFCSRHQPQVVLLGQGTGAREIAAGLVELSVPVRWVSERDTTRQARARYFAEHPPRGWRRLLPLSLQTPPEPVDDYAAWLIAEQFLSDPSVDDSSSKQTPESEVKKQEGDLGTGEELVEGKGERLFPH